MIERRVRVTGRASYAGRMERPSMRRERVKRPSLSMWQRRLIILVVVIVAALWGLDRLFNIRMVTVKASSSNDQIKAATQTILAKSWRQQNLLTLDGGALVSNLQQAEPVLKTVTIKRQWPHGLVVTATLKQPSMGWSSGNQSYLLDLDGTAIGALPAGSAYPVVTDGSNLPVQIGQSVVSTRFVAFVTGLVPALAGDGVQVTELEVKDTTLDLTVSTNKGYQLIFDTSRSVGDEMADLKAVQAVLTAQKKVPSSYIDLRIAGKAYYK